MNPKLSIEPAASPYLLAAGGGGISAIDSPGNLRP